MNAQRSLPVLIAGAAVAGLAVVSCGTVQRGLIAPPPEIEGAVFVGNSQCYPCHSNYVRRFSFSAHGRLQVQSAKMPGQTGCEACHGPGSKHLTVGGGRGRFIVNPGKNPAACYSCHPEVQLEFALPVHHPVPEGHMSCTDCHDPHGLEPNRPANLALTARQNAPCAPCHREQTRLVIYRHEALRDGCPTCHAPHGSINPKLLVQRDANLCLRCHAQVPGPQGEVFIGKKAHRARLAQEASCTSPGCHSGPVSGPPCGCATVGTCWSAGCHTAPHGSNVNPYFLY